MSPSPAGTAFPSTEPVADLITDPVAIRRIFERRADRAERVSFLPREIAGRMRERLEYIKLDPKHVLDAGCGTGADLPALRERFPDAAVWGVDLAAAMVRAAAHANAGASAPGNWLPRALRRWRGDRARQVVQADFSRLPFRREAFDFVWSNQALHWHRFPDQVFPEWRRVLRVGGLLMFSMLGPDSLRELRAAYAEADPGVPHVLDFVDMHDVGDMLVSSGFEAPVMDMERLTVTYTTPASLLEDVRGWGAYPPHGFARKVAAEPATLRRGLGGVAIYKRVLAALEGMRNTDGVIPLTFEIVYGHAWAARTTTTPEGHGVIQLDEIGGRRSRR